MPLFVKINNKRLWDKPSWLPVGEVVAEALSDFKIDSNELSVWYVEPDESNIDRILTALAANRDFIDKIDFAILDDTLVGDCGLIIRKTAGRSPDDHASTNWHRDLVELSGRKLVCIAESIGAGVLQRKSRAAVKTLLTAAAQTGQLKRELMQESVASKLSWPS